MSGAVQSSKGNCARCRSVLEIPAESDPARDDVQMCHQCWDDDGREFVDSHYRGAIGLGLYPRVTLGGDVGR